ncbi:MAG: hypothetical protein J7L11_08945 [Thermoprotei archaeon]|nr:hypothetical protein [Thermoprotei archaeon]
MVGHSSGKTVRVDGNGWILIPRGIREITGVNGSERVRVMAGSEGDNRALGSIADKHLEHWPRGLGYGHDARRLAVASCT